MNKSVFISEQEKKQIYSMYHILNESIGSSKIIGVVVLVNSNTGLNEYEPDLKVYLSSNGKRRGSTTDTQGNFSFDNVEDGDYTISCDGELYGYNYIEKKITISNNVIKNENGEIISDLKIRLTTIQEIESVTIHSNIEKITLINLEFVDENNIPLKNVIVRVKDGIGSDISIEKNSDNFGKISDMKISGEEEITDILISFDYYGIKGYVSKKISYLNSFYNVVQDKIGYFLDKESKEVKDKNFEKITIKTKIDFKINVEPTTIILNNSNTTIKGSDGIRIKSKNNTYTYTITKNTINKINLDINHFEYDNYNKYFTLKFGEDIDVKLTKKIIIPPIKVEPSFNYNLKSCQRITKKHYNDMLNVGSNKLTIKTLGGDNIILKQADIVLSCYIKYKKEYKGKLDLVINRLTSTQPKLESFRLKWTLDQRRDIYKENRTMSITNSIQKVIFEHLEKKQNVFEEKQLIKKRFRFSLNGVNKNKRRVVESLLRNEKRFLINSGYSSRIVNETFLDVMNSLYGSEGNNVLKDVKLRLGQKIADQVKNKEDEHSMILSAFEDLPEDVVERAIKENRVDELSSLISQKAIEGYKVKFGTEGISGIMFSSLDENKFKMEVSKLIEPAIKEITTKMEEKFKQVKDAFGGSDLSSSI